MDAIVSIDYVHSQSDNVVKSSRTEFSSPLQMFSNISKIIITVIINNCSMYCPILILALCTDIE